MQSSRSASSVLDDVGRLFADYTVARSPRKSAKRPMRVSGGESSAASANSRQEEELGDESDESVEFEIPLKSHDGPASADAQVSHELERIYELWQRAKHELEKKNQEVKQLRQASGLGSRRISGSSGINKSSSRLGALKNDELVRQVTGLEQQVARVSSQLKAARAENDRWSHSYEVLTNELQLVRELQESARRFSARSETEFQQLNDAVERLQHENRRLASALQSSRKEYDQDMECGQNKVEALERHIKLLAKEMDDTRVEKESFERRVQSLETDLADRDSIIEQHREKVHILQQDVDSDARLASRFQIREWQVRLDHLKVDVARLLELLKSTSEYRHFCDNLKDVGGADGLTYLPGAGSILPGHHLMFSSDYSSATEAGAVKSSSSCHTACKSPRGKAKRAAAAVGKAWARAKRSEILALEQEYDRQRSGLLIGDARASKNTSISEEDNWVPRQALEVAAGFRKRCIPHVSINVVAELLRELNRIWQAHYFKATAKLRETHKRELYEMRRRTKQSASYQDVMAKNKVERLEKSLRSVKDASQRKSFLSSSSASVSSKSSFAALRKNALGTPFDRSKLEDGSQLGLSACLQELEHVSAKLRMCQDENIRLRIQVEKSQGLTAELKLESLFARTTDLLDKLQVRIDQGLSRIARLATTTRSIDSDHINLVNSVYSAMTDEIQQLVSQIRQDFTLAINRSPDVDSPRRSHNHLHVSDLL